MPHRTLHLKADELDPADGRRVLVWALPPSGPTEDCTFIGSLLDGETLPIPVGATYVRAAEAHADAAGPAVQYVRADGPLWREYAEPRDDRVLEG